MFQTEYVHEMDTPVLCDVCNSYFDYEDDTHCPDCGYRFTGEVYN